MSKRGGDQADRNESQREQVFNRIVPRLGLASESRIPYTELGAIWCPKDVRVARDQNVLTQAHGSSLVGELSLRAPAVRPGVRRWLWFVALWAAGVATVGVVSLILRAWIGRG